MLSGESSEPRRFPLAACGRAICCPAASGKTVTPERDARMDEFFRHFLELFTNTDAAVDWWLAALGAWIYLGLFLILFCETGLVVTPVLPGDSLLFAVGAVAVREGSGLS